MGMPAALRVVSAEAIGYRRVWRGTVISSFVIPFLFLTGMGIGLGNLVDRGDSTILTIPYVTFIASGLMAANAMQTGFGEGAFPVMAGIKWRKSFHAVIATPVSPTDLVVGRLIWGALRLTFGLVVFALIAVGFDAIELGPALLAVGPAVLCGTAFTAVATAFTASIETEAHLTTVMRFVILPLFLFSGTFFPVGQLPDFLQGIAVATPLFHGVELVRKLALPSIDAPMVSTIPIWVHFAYLTGMLLAGATFASWKLGRRLKP